MGALKSSAEIDRVFQSGQRIPSKLVISLVAPTPEGRDRNGRVAVIAGKKLGGAVVRNRAKRLLRAAVREAGGPWPGRDVVLIARESALASNSSDISRAIAHCMEQVTEAS